MSKLMEEREGARFEANVQRIVELEQRLDIATVALRGIVKASFLESEMAYLLAIRALAAIEGKNER
jgi:hypothetical protein